MPIHATIIPSQIFAKQIPRHAPQILAADGEATIAARPQGEGLSVPLLKS